MDPFDISNLVAELNLEKEANDAVIEVRLDEETKGAGVCRGRVGKMVVGKIFASRIANRETLRFHVPKILRTREEVDIEVVGDNLFAIIFSNERDRNHALLDGPWHFFDSYMAFKEPKGLEKPSDIQFTDFTTLIQCHNLPLQCMNPNIIRQIGEAVGKVEEIDEGEGGNCLGQYARIRVTRRIDKPLQRCVRVTLDTSSESQTILIRYERLREFCQACGRLGHTARHCQDQSVDKTKKSFGPWLRALRTQELRRNRNTNIRGDKADGNTTTSMSEANIKTRDKQNREELAVETIGENGIVSHRRSADYRGAVGMDILPSPIKGPEKTDNAQGDAVTAREIYEIKLKHGSKEISEGRSTAEGVRDTILKKSKDARIVRGWKRRARATIKSTETSTETGMLVNFQQAGRKRIGEPVDDEIGLHIAKQTRITLENQGEETTAATALQSRRSP